MSEENELRPCPFCGGEVAICEFYSGDETTYYLECDKCDIPVTVDYQEKDELFSHWNTRPLEDALTAENKRLEERVALLREDISELLLLIEEHGNKTILAHAKMLLGIRNDLLEVNHG